MSDPEAGQNLGPLDTQETSGADATGEEAASSSGDSPQQPPNIPAVLPDEMAPDPAPPATGQQPAGAVSSSPITGQVVCVPVELDAFVLNETLFDQGRKSRIAATVLPDYAALGPGLYQKPDIIDHIDLQTATPIDRNSRITDVAGSGKRRTERLGVYLHWVLPKAFRSGIAATETASMDFESKRIESGLPAQPEGAAPATPDHPEFRPIPDRWIIYRFLRSGVRKGAQPGSPSQCLTDAAAFIVESNVLRETEDFEPSCDIEMEAAPFLNSDPDVTAGDQDNYWLGCKSPLGGWRERDSEALHPSISYTGRKPKQNPEFHSPLTVTDTSNPLFADYAPYNTNVFSIHDDLTAFESADVSYFVMGYYSRSNQDPFTCDSQSLGSKPIHSSILKACFMELSGKTKTPTWTEEQAISTRLVCHGSLYNVKWSRKEVPHTIPADSHASHFEETHPVAVGKDTLDALETYIDIESEIESTGIIHGVSALLKSEHETVHARRLAEKDLIKRSFHPSPSGSEWHLNKTTDASNLATSAASAQSDVATASAILDLKASADSAIDQAPMAKRPSPVEMALLHQLNVLQRYHDACDRRYSELQFLLFAEWWKHRAEPPETDTDLVNSEAKQSARLAAIRAKVAQLVAGIRWLKPSPVDGTNGKLEALKSKLELLCRHPCLSGQVKQAAEHPFYNQKDPSLVLVDVKNPWPGAGNLTVRLHTDIPPFTTDSDVLSQVLNDTGALDDELEPSELAKCPQQLLEWLPWWEMFKSGREKLPTAIQDAFSALLKEWLMEDSKPGPTTTSSNWNNTQAWWPLFIEWETQYFHIPWKQWGLHAQSEGAISYVLNSNHISDVKGIRDDVRTMTGRSLVLPQVSRMLRAHVDQLFKRLKPNDLNLNPEEKDSILEQVDQLPFLASTLEGFNDHLTTFVHGTHVTPHIETGNSATTLPTANGQELFPPEVIRLLEGSSADVSPYGRYLDLTHHRRDARDNNFSPFKPVTHGQARFTKLNMVDKFGQVVPAMTMLDNQDDGFLLPFTSSAFACQSRDPENANGERYFANTVVENSEGQCEFYQLPPSLNQNARINASFVVEVDAKNNNLPENSSDSRNWRPCLEWENPIWAWLMINFRDQGLQIFHEDGTFISEVLLRKEKTYWQPQAPFEDSDTEDESSGDDEAPAKKQNLTPELLEFLRKLKSPAYVETLMRVINDALENLHHAPNSFAGELPALFGRPLALVNMGWSLELAEAPLVDQSTSVNLEGAPKADSILDYQFELKIGDKQSYHDGLIGYYQQDANRNMLAAEVTGAAPGLPQTRKHMKEPGTGLDFGTIITDFGTHLESKDVPPKDLICTGAYSKVKPFFIDPMMHEPESFENAKNQKLQIFAALLDPFSVISGYTGILPPKQLQLPAWTVEQALKQMTPFLSVGPLLVPGDIPDAQLLPVAAVGGAADYQSPATSTVTQHDSHNPPTIPVQVPGSGEWLWLQPYLDDDDAAYVDYRAIHAISTAPDATKLDLLDGPHTAVSGFLQLKTPPLNLVGARMTDLSSDDFGAFFGVPAVNLDIGGRGSSGGLPGEEVDIIFVVQSSKVAMADPSPDWRSGFPENYTLAMELTASNAANGSSKQKLVFNQPLGLRYVRPVRDYTLTISVADEQTGLSFVFNLSIPVNSRREDVLSSQYSTLDIPSKVTIGYPFAGTITLRDRCNNVCKGYDDSKLVGFEGLSITPKVIARSSDYRVKFGAVRIPNSVLVITLDNEPLDEPASIKAFPDIDITKTIIKGTAICTGVAKEQVDLRLLLFNHDGARVTDADVKVMIVPSSGPRFALNPKMEASAKKGEYPWWVVNFPRPAFGNYQVRVHVNSRLVSPSPILVASVAQPAALDMKHIGFSLATSSTSQAAAVRILDSISRRWYDDTEMVKGIRLRFRRADSSSETRRYMLRTTRGDGMYQTNLDLPPKTSWSLIVDLVLADGTIVEYDVPAIISVSDKGQLQIGWNKAWDTLGQLGDEEQRIGEFYAVGRILPFSRWGLRRMTA